MIPDFFARQLSAGEVEPSPRRYAVAYLHAHETLAVGDIVVVSVNTKSENVLIRLSDMTLHEISDKNEQYVHLVETG
jgi:hypothetical protein